MAIQRDCKLCGEPLTSEKQAEQLQKFIARTRASKLWQNPTERQLRQLVYLESLLKKCLDGKVYHDVAKCENTELLKGRKEIKRLKESLASWKDAWFQMREIIGNLWWYHPAIDNDEQRVYYRKVRRGFRGESDPRPWAADSKYVNNGTIQKDGQTIGRWK